MDNKVKEIKTGVQKTEGEIIRFMRDICAMPSPPSSMLCCQEC